MQTKFSRSKRVEEHFEPTKDDVILMPGCCPSVSKIAEMFFDGRPMEQLQANLPFNDIENNPLYQKGVDLADLPEIMREVSETKEQAMKEINEYAHKKQTSKADELGSLNPDLNSAPEKIE